MSEPELIELRASRELLEQVLAELHAGVNVRQMVGADELPAWVGAVLPVEGKVIGLVDELAEHVVIIELAYGPGGCELRLEVDGQRVWSRPLEYSTGGGLELTDTL